MITVTKKEEVFQVLLQLIKTKLFAIYTPGFWQEIDTKTLEELEEETSSNHINLHVEEINNRELGMKKKRFKTYQISDLEDYSKIKDFFETLKSMKKNDREDTVFRLNLTYNEMEQTLE